MKHIKCLGHSIQHLKINGCEGNPGKWNSSTKELKIEQTSH